MITRKLKVGSMLILLALSFCVLGKVSLADDDPLKPVQWGGVKVGEVPGKAADDVAGDEAKKKELLEKFGELVGANAKKLLSEAEISMAKTAVGSISSGAVDTNKDGKVDIVDLTTVAQYFGQTGSGTHGYDFDGDNQITDNDLIVVAYAIDRGFSFEYRDEEVVGKNGEKTTIERAIMKDKDGNDLPSLSVALLPFDFLNYRESALQQKQEERLRELKEKALEIIREYVNKG